MKRLPLMLQKPRVLQLQGAKGEAVVFYREPLATKKMQCYRLSRLGWSVAESEDQRVKKYRKKHSFLEASKNEFPTINEIGLKHRVIKGSNHFLKFFYAALGIIVYSMVFFSFAGIVHSDELGFEDAGHYYNISPILLAAISYTESRFNNDAVNSNKNGSRDICHMQLNTCHKKHLQDNWQYLDNPKYCTMVGAWILRQCMDRYGYTWEAVACYHTGYSPHDAPTQIKKTNGRKYILKVQNAIEKIRNGTNLKVNVSHR